MVAIAKIHRYTAGMDYPTFAADERTIDAVIRNFSVIGEAASQLPDEYVVRQPSIPWNEMRGMRNVIIHEYFGISLPILWETIQNDLPAVERALGALIDAEGDR